MTPREFCYWLQGVFEVAKLTSLNEEQTTQIKNHLNLAFVHIDAQEEDETGLSAEAMQKIHDGLIKPKKPGRTRPKGFDPGQLRC